MMKSSKKLLAILPIALVFFALYSQTEVYGQNATTSLPIIQSTIIRNTARITFEWPQPVKFTAHAKGTQLSIVFDRKADPDFDGLLSGLYPYITSAHRKNDGKTIILTLNKPYKIRTFLSDAVGGVELLDIEPEQQHARLKQVGYFPTLVPSADGSHSEEMEAIKINISASDSAATLRFPFTKRMAIAAYIRDEMLWIILNNASKLDLSDFNDMAKTVIGKAELIPAKKTILRIPITDNAIKAFVAKEDNSSEWVIILSRIPKPPANPLKVAINTDPPAPPNVFIPSLEMGEPVTMTDPIVGDELVITPLFKPGEAIPFQRDFVDFSLLESTQGVVVAKKTEEAFVLPVRNGLRISVPGGAMLTPGLPEVDNSKKLKLLQNVATMFSYKDWKIDNPSTRSKQIKIFSQKIIDGIASSDMRSANEYRLKLAQIYLSEGLAVESIGFLDGINRTNPTFYKSAKLAALHGAANFLMLRYNEAAQDFNATELNYNKEMDYWRNMLANLNGAKEHYNYMDMNDDYIAKYPPVFRQRLAIAAADHAVGEKEYNTALKIFETLGQVKKPTNKEGEQEDVINAIIPYVNFILGRISVDTGDVDEGIANWNILADDASHPYVQARAEFSRVAWQLNHNGLSKTEAIDRLERLRLRWHGDDLELQMLNLLGELYFDQKDYVNAMRVWDDGINSFPDTPEAQEMTHRIEETFTLLFGSGTADAFSNMEALTLYYQYKNYAPSGDLGRDIFAKLADRLVSVDLLDQATNLLEHQMHFESEKTKRSQIGAKVAMIHLLNHQPKKAMAALQDSVYGENPTQLRQIRNRLTSQAFFDMGRYDEAWLTLGQDESPDADLIRLNIYWERKEWKQVIALVEIMMKTRKDVTAPITVQESEYLLKLALAYVFENNSVQLEYLHDYFEPLMSNNPNKSLFDFITAEDASPTPKNFDNIVRNLSETRSFINNYKARIKLSGLDAAITKQ